MRFPFAVALTALAGSAVAQTRPHTFDLQDVRWEVQLKPDQGEIVGTVTNRLVPTKGATQIELDAFRLKIERVEIDGKRAKFKADGKKLLIDLPKPGDGTTELAVAIRYSGKPDVGIYFIPGNKTFPAKTPVVFTQGEMEDTRGWLPTYDYPDDKATSEGIITVPAGWSVLSNGRLIERRTHGKEETWHWKMEQPHSTYLISLVAGPYTELVETTTPVPVSVWVPKGLEEWGRAAFGDTARIVAFYGKITGTPYPYVKYAQSAVPQFMFGGMENITCTTQTISAIFPKASVGVRDATGLVAHELAHQWTGDLVTTSGWSDIWINEGWASFLPTFWTRERDGLEAYDLDRYGTFQGGLSGAQSAPTRTEVSTNYKEPLDMFDSVTYPGGASRMFMLMHQLGEDLFWKTAKAFFDERKYTSFDTHAFFDTWSRHSGVDLTAFKEQWFFKPSAPRLKVSYNKGDLVVTQSTPTFKLVDLPVWFLDGDEWVKKTITVDGPESRLSVGALAGKPALLDPECWLMGWIENEIPLTNAQRIDLFNAAPNAAEKARIMDTMLSPLTPTERVQLAASMKSTLLLNRYMGQLQGAEAVSFVVRKLEDQDPRIVNTAAGVLRSLPKNDAALQALVQLSNTHPNEEVKFTAFRSRLYLTGEAGLADLAWSKERYDDGYRQLALDWLREKQPDAARTRALQAVKGDFPEPTRAHAARILGALKDLPGKHEVFDVLLKMARDTTYTAQSAAVSALGEYGDPRAIPVLQPLRDHGLIFMRNVANDALNKLQKK